MNKSYTLSDQTSAGCRDADTWRDCKQKVIRTCLGLTTENLAAAKDKLTNDAATVESEAQKFSERVPDPSKE